MENKANVIIEIGLQRDEENGDVAAFAFDLPKGVAERVCLEQEKCELLCEGGALSRLLNAYALLNGYECAWFVSARMSEAYNLDNKYFGKDIIIDSLAKCGTKDCGSCSLYHFALENGEYKSKNCLQLAAGVLRGLSEWNDDLIAENAMIREEVLSADTLIEENAGLRESVLFLQTELEEARKSVQAHELAGKLFEMKNTQLEKKLEAADAERADAVMGAIRRMQEELKAVKVHFDGVSLKAVPFGCIDAAAEKVLREVADGTKE